MDKKSKLKNRLECLRINKNLSKIDVAVKLKTNPEAISRIETGDRNVSIDEGYELAKLYELSMEEIYNAKNELIEI